MNVNGDETIHFKNISVKGSGLGTLLKEVMSRRLLSFISEFIVVFTHIKLLLYIYEEDIKKVSSGSTNHIIFGDFFCRQTH